MIHKEMETKKSINDLDGVCFSLYSIEAYIIPNVNNSD